MKSEVLFTWTQLFGTSSTPLRASLITTSRKELHKDFIELVKAGFSASYSVPTCQEIQF